MRYAAKLVAVLSVLGVLTGATTASAQGLQALARVDVTKSTIEDASDGGVSLNFQLSQPVPFRVFTLTEPARVVMDFKEIDWSGFNEELVDQSAGIEDVRVGIFRPGWSRMVMDIASPLAVRLAEMRVDDVRGTAVLAVDLAPASPEAFAKASQIREEDGWALPKPTAVGTPKERQLGDRPVVVVVDPGHGGVDSGAERDGFEEKILVMQFSLELQEALRRTGRYVAELTRTEDVFMSLPDRITRARELNADIFLSIHADALSEGSATGTTVYTLSDEASSSMAAELAAGHDRGDLLAGVDLTEQDDLIAGVLMDMARLETDVRSEMAADLLVNGIAQSIGRIRKRPHLGAGFTVLKAPDIPSVLIELGFMSNKSDLNNLLTESWRQKVIKGVINALDDWAIEDAAQGRLLRQ